MLVLHLQIASIIFEIKLYQLTVLLEYLDLLQQFLRCHVVNFFSFLKICAKLGRSGPNNNFSNRYGLTCDWDQAFSLAEYC